MTAAPRLISSNFRPPESPLGCLPEEGRRLENGRVNDLREVQGSDSALVYTAMRELRGQSAALASPQTFAAWVVAEAGQGYRLLGAFVPGGREAVAVAGFRVLNLLYSGPQLYVDDLSTLPAFRGQGHARALLGWLEGEARRLGCLSMHLDSGVQRFPAHRLYLGCGFDITAHHFARRLEP